MSIIPKHDILAMRQYLLANEAGRPSTLRNVIIWLSRFGYSEAELPHQLGLTKQEIANHLSVIDFAVREHRLDTTLYQGDGRFGKLFLVFAELLDEHTIKGEEIDAAVGAVLLQVLGLELDVRGLEGFMIGWHTGRLPLGQEYKVVVSHFQSYFETLLKYNGYPGAQVPTDSAAFLQQWCSYRDGLAQFKPLTRQYGYDNDRQVSTHNQPQS